jgi:hypothetical protein
MYSLPVIIIADSNHTMGRDLREILSSRGETTSGVIRNAINHHLITEDIIYENRKLEQPIEFLFMPKKQNAAIFVEMNQSANSNNYDISQIYLNRTNRDRAGFEIQFEIDGIEAAKKIIGSGYHGKLAIYSTLFRPEHTVALSGLDIDILKRPTAGKLYEIIMQEQTRKR